MDQGTLSSSIVSEVLDDEINVGVSSASEGGETSVSNVEEILSVPASPDQNTSNLFKDDLR